MTIGTKQYVKEPLSRSKCTVLVTGTHIASAPCSVRSVACVVLDFCMARSSLTSFKKKKIKVSTVCVPKHWIFSYIVKM